ncbi:protein cortex-like [Hyposmocoma kahamanoa]|uniref:protein cortex-like n=1 Tax=Hyposmocoma kahamanoa TaxID=1477025 RepID=UPI000E6D6542|nr:protein cortex-like [Hyposmocoma kahamanoa]
MEENLFATKNSKVDNRGVDRFVLPRHVLSDIRMRQHYYNSLEKVDIWDIKHQQQKKYKNYLTTKLGLKQQLKFPKDEVSEQPWPCVPRKQSYLSSAYNILDLPHLSYAFYPEILDWGAGNILVAALGKTYHMFSWQNQRVTGHGFSRYMINCCKFNPQGDVLLIGTNANFMELHDKTWVKRSPEAYCKCKVRHFICAITSIDWSPTGNSFVAGCSRGAVSAFDQFGFHCSRWNGKGRSVIMAVRVSPDARYVAVASMNSSVVHILLWPSLKYYSNLDVNWFVKSIVWHPWRSALLGVGVAVPDFRTMIVLWETPSGRLRHTNLGNYYEYNLDCMLFSHRTGEMVLSLWNPAREMQNPKASTQLVVMSDPSTVVDQSGIGRGDMDRVQTMVFSPDGTKLATATSDEDLLIWNFLPEDKTKKKVTKSRKFSTLPVYMDALTQGFVLR